MAKFEFTIFVTSLLIIYIASQAYGELAFGKEFGVYVIQGNYSTDNVIIVNGSRQFLLRFDDFKGKYPIKITANILHHLMEYPVTVITYQETAVASWLLPLAVDSQIGIIQYTNTSRTLCHTDMGKIVQIPRNKLYSNDSYIPELSQSLAVGISTFSSTATQITIRAEAREDFYLIENKEYTARISPSEPAYYYYKFYEKDHDKYTNTVLLEIDSEDDICLIVSVQKPSCPVSDLNKDIKFEGKYQTINKKGGITITKNEFPHGFFLVFVAQVDNYDCSKEMSVIPVRYSSLISPLNRTATVNFQIRSGIRIRHYVRATLIVLAAILGFYIVFLPTIWAFYRFGKVFKIAKEHSKTAIPEDTEDTEDADVTLRNRSERLTISTALGMAKLHVADLSKKGREFYQKKSLNYLWHVMSIAIFYSIPVVQLAVTYQRIVNLSGNQDLCYYNFLCAMPLYGLSDFNHIYSNIGYALVGILVLIITLYKHKKVVHREDCGIPEHYGIFYAMGVALIIEGLLSACYHICPTQSNYQFDTSFMYVMAVLCMIKLYQNRHPDVNATAYATFSVLGVGIFAAMVGILHGTLTVWIIFIISYVSLCLYVSFNIYYLNNPKRGTDALRQDFQSEISLIDTFNPRRKKQFILLLIANLVNAGMAFIGIYCYFIDVDFPTFLLGVLMGNTVLYTTIYIVLKLINRERICAQAIMFGVLTLATWGGSMYFFLNISTQWAVTPAESRQFNTRCKMLDFFDNHDIWHLLSAPALFFSFMLLLTLDDDLINTPRSKIDVF